jgi:monoamine oxidase
VSAERFDVVIVGAGMAGLAALRDLDRAGKRVLCLEARDRTGGRICTMRDQRSPVPIELGAEFVHGRPREILDIAESAPLTLYRCTEDSVHVRNGDVIKKEDAWLQVDEVMQSLENAADTAPDETFTEFLSATGYSQIAKELATGYVEGFNAARSEVISVHSLVKDERAADQIGGDAAFRIMNGYEAVPHWFVQGISELRSKLALSSEVRSIRWRPGDARVEFTSRPDGSMQTVTAQKVIVAVPLGVLQANVIRFDPEPMEALHEANRLRFGHVFRVVMRFRKAIWNETEKFESAGFFLSNEKHFPTWWTTLPVISPLITGWSAGARTDELIGLPQSEIVNLALRDLARILNVNKHRLAGSVEAVHIHNWQSDPWTRGAYSYVPAGAMIARERLAQPIGTSLYFAGEATETEGHSATVHGAIASGRRAAKQALAG